MMTSKLLSYIDSFGFLAQRGPGRDGGDSIHRESFHAAFMFWNPNSTPGELYLTKLNYRRNLKQCFRLGNIRRHPDPEKWYREWNRGSRDQSIAVLVACGALGMYIPAMEMFFRHLLTRLLLFASNTRRNFVYPTKEEHLAKSTPDVLWNYKWKVPDLTLFKFLATYIRVFRYHLFPICLVLTWVYGPLSAIIPYALILLGDLETLLGSFNKVYLYGKDPKNSDDNNHILVLCFSNVLPTPLSWLAKKVYRKRPKAAAPACGYQSDFGPQTALDYYFREENNDPPLNETARPVLEKLL